MKRTNGRSAEPTVDAGVIGVGTMGNHHARVYNELPGVTLAGVSDVDGGKARTVAAEHGTEAFPLEDLLASVDVASVAVPTEYHYDMATACIDHDVDVLVEKPFVADLDRGRDLVTRARDANVTLQVGHVERFNPAVRVLADIVPDLDIVAVDIQRLGPPIDRELSDSVVFDLMVHDIDILLSLVGSEVASLSATGKDGRHVSSQIEFADGSIGELTASRLTQQKVRTLALTAMECRVTVDFISQSVEIHRQSLPAYVQDDGDVRYRHESVVERPMVESGEPLKNELSSFVEAARDGTEPLVTAEDAIRVLEVADRIETKALGRKVSA